MRIISLHVNFNDEQTGSGYHSGTAVYTFRNEFLKPVKLVLPPVGYTYGGLAPITPQCTDHARMPTFCEPARIIELKPNEAQSFESKYNLVGPEGRAVEHFVFGPAKEADTNDVFVGEVVSTSVIHPAR